MGTWADDIFGNDLACDVRDGYRERLAAGENVEAAVRRMKRAFAESLRDGDEKRTVWIALAAAQLESGEVSAEVREKALKSITWYETPDRDPERFPFGAEALAGLRENLGGPAPAPARKAKPKVPPGDEGDVLAVKLPHSDREAVIVVTDA